MSIRWALSSIWESVRLNLLDVNNASNRSPDNYIENTETVVCSVVATNVIRSFTSECWLIISSTVVKLELARYNTGLFERLPRLNRSIIITSKTVWNHPRNLLSWESNDLWLESTRRYLSVSRIGWESDTNWWLCSYWAQRAMET
jgi:hypothetical protein